MRINTNIETLAKPLKGLTGKSTGNKIALTQKQNSKQPAKLQEQDALETHETLSDEDLVFLDYACF